MCRATGIVLFMFVTAVMAQLPEPPLSDTRFTVHTLVREDIFAGYLQGDMTRLARAEKNIEALLETRPGARPDLLAWKGGATLYRAVRALEEKRNDEFSRLYKEAVDLFAGVRRSNPEHAGVAAVTGGSYAFLADRLPKEQRAAAWSEAYDAYRVLWKLQAAVVDKLPLHIKGELLAGLAQSSQRTGRSEEAGRHLDKILEALPGAPYESVARQWKANPQAAGNASITCLSCHDDGRLSARISALGVK